MKRNSLTNLPYVLLNLYSAAVYLFLFIPILTIVCYSFNSGRLLLVWQGFSFAPYHRAFSNTQMMNSVVVSLQAAAISALIATFLGSLAGLYLARKPGWHSKLFIGMLSIVLVTPEIVNAVALLPWFVFLGVDASMSAFNNGLLRLAIGHSLFPTAVVTFIVRARMVGINAWLEDAAADLYASPLRRFCGITFPMMFPAVVAGGLLAATMSMDNVIISSFVSVQGSSPWPVFVFGSLRSGMRPEIAALSTVICMVIILIVLVAALLLKSGTQMSAGKDV